MTACFHILNVLLMLTSPVPAAAPSAPKPITPQTPPTAPELPTHKKDRPVVYDAIKYSAAGQGVATRRELARLNIPTIPMAYHGGVDWNQDGVITESDRRQFRKWIDSTIPANATGPAVMDYEQPWWDELNAKTLDPDTLNEVLAVYLDGLAEARALRPGLEWGYWGLPTMRNVSKGWADQGLSIAPLINASGAVYPSAYDCNPGDNSDDFGRHVTRVLEAVNGQRPVIVFLSIRFCGQNKDRSKFLPMEELLSNANAVLGATWTAPDGTVHRATGIALWDPYIWSDEADWPALDRLHAETFSRLSALAELLRPAQPSSSSPPPRPGPRGDLP
ncbi:MAG: hyaluronidase [Phycisphaerales bacterium]|nr:hyaluronidase [Phycisphaerales bacterium]